jgi:hypothetical protein
MTSIYEGTPEERRARRERQVERWERHADQTEGHDREQNTGPKATLFDMSHSGRIIVCRTGRCRWESRDYDEVAGPTL